MQKDTRKHIYLLPNSLNKQRGYYVIFNRYIPTILISLYIINMISTGSNPGGNSLLWIPMHTYSRVSVQCMQVYIYIYIYIHSYMNTNTLTHTHTHMSATRTGIY